MWRHEEVVVHCGGDSAAGDARTCRQLAQFSLPGSEETIRPEVFTIPALMDPSKNSPDELLLTQTFKSHATMVQSIETLDSKAGSVVSLAAVLSGLILASGIIAFREFWNPEQESGLWLIPLGILLALAIGASLTALTLAAFAWRRAEILVIKPRELAEKFEMKTETELRRFLVVQLAYEFDRMAKYRKQTRRWLGAAFLALGISVVTLLIYAALAVYVLVT